MDENRIFPWEISRISEPDDFSQSVFFVGNGHLGVRGFGAWARKASPQSHAVFRAGLFSEISRGITDMVQLPDVLTLRPVGEEPAGAVRQTLDMRRGVLTHAWETERARVLMARTVSMADPQLILERLTITAKTSFRATVQAVADPLVRNLPVHDDQTMAAADLVALLAVDELRDGSLRLHTVAEKTPVSLFWRVRADRPCDRTFAVLEGAAVETLSTDLASGDSFTVEKRVRILAEDERAREDAADPWAESELAWRRLWDACDIVIDADDPDLQGALRYNIFQLLANDDGDNPDVSIGARGLTHGRYKGNAFWDTEIFLLPFFLWTRPQAARNLLVYRTARFPQARALAKKQNLSGARFPWMSAHEGVEQCESWDIGLCEVHVTADVIYALQRYAEVTGDEAFLRGLPEVFRETGLYWLDRLTWEPDKKCFSSFFVKGPDEYCGATVNNTYTNYLARNNLRLALRWGNLTPEENARFRDAEKRVAILYDPARKLYLQDELLERLPPAPFLKEGDEPAYRRICFDRLQRYRVLKQADLVLLMTLFPDDFTPEEKGNVFRVYEPLTLHDSTLSWGAHALLALRLQLWDKAEGYLRKALYLDLRDMMGNTGREGLHMAALGEAWQAVVFGAAGLWSENGRLRAEPMLPPGIRRIAMSILYRGQAYTLDVTRSGARLERK